MQLIIHSNPDSKLVFHSVVGAVWLRHAQFVQSMHVCVFGTKAEAKLHDAVPTNASRKARIHHAFHFDSWSLCTQNPFVVSLLPSLSLFL